MESERKSFFPAAETILRVVVIGGLAALFGLAIFVPTVAMVA